MSMPRRLKYAEHPSLFDVSRLVENKTQAFAKEELLKDLCPQGAQRLGQDQYRCGKCGLVWDVDEPRPPCDNTK